LGGNVPAVVAPAPPEYVQEALVRVLATVLALLLGGAVGMITRTAHAQSVFSPVPDKLSWQDVLQTKSMHYALIKHGRANILFVWGEVEDDASNHFRDALDQAKPIDEIWLYSQGGNLEEGLEIGRMIHARKLATHIIAGQRCVSACNFIFMGGVIRYVDSGAAFVVHMFSDNESDDLLQDLSEPPHSYQTLLKKYSSMDINDLINEVVALYPDFKPTPESFQAALKSEKQKNASEDNEDLLDLDALEDLITDYNNTHKDAQVNEHNVIRQVVLSEDVKRIQMSSAQTSAEIARYLTEMGLSLKFLTRFATIHNDDPTPLTRDELREFNVINID
jgi:hypothetical protein